MVDKIVTKAADGSYTITKSGGTPWTSADIFSIGYSTFATIEYHEYFNWILTEFKDCPSRIEWAEKMLHMYSPCNNMHLDKRGIKGIERGKKIALESREKYQKKD